MHLLINKLKKLLRGKSNASLIKGTNNQVSQNIPNTTVRIFGNNNRISIQEHKYLKNTTIEIFGDNNEVIFHAGVHGEFEITIGSRNSPTHNSSLNIGDNTGSNGTNILLFENKSSIKIGRDCMFGSGTWIWASDTHAIYDHQNILLNYGESVKIGHHVWLGTDVKVGKNTYLPDNTIVGWGSVVTKKFTEPNTILAGNPAKVVKQGVNWSKERPEQFLQRNPK